MVRPLSMDLRQRVVAAHLSGAGTYAELAEEFSIGEASVSRWLRRERAGELEPKSPPGRARKLGKEHELVVVALVTAAPDATLKELVERLHAQAGIAIGISTMFSTLARLGLTRKKRPPRE